LRDPPIQEGEANFATKLVMADPLVSRSSIGEAERQNLTVVTHLGAFLRAIQELNGSEQLVRPYGIEENDRAIISKLKAGRLHCVILFCTATWPASR
jgi:hypothetical protein